MKKVCFVASSGGHWEELMCLKSIFNKYDSFFVTEEGGQIQDANLDNIYIFSQINRRESLFIIHFLEDFFRAMKILIKEKPEAVVTTGALISFPFCLIAKLMRKKIVYIESFARVSSASLTGKLVYRFADLFVVQWEDMLRVYPKAKFIGGIF